SRTYAVFGFQGLAPYVIEVDASLFVSEKGDLSARFEAEHDILITQRLIAQPKLEVSAALQEVEELGIGAGLNDIELGFRVRYEITRKFAPYVGISWSRSLGKTADFARAEGEDADSLALLAGVRFAF
ncbi:MAG: copper resistance protein B, partial [Alphaproteobacteria bacterium]|nr:copper resistance protein B [Alphaproteobacteria bacterium]